MSVTKAQAEKIKAIRKEYNDRLAMLDEDTSLWEQTEEQVDAVYEQAWQEFNRKVLEVLKLK